MFFFPLLSNTKIDTPVMKDDIVHLNVALQHPLENKMNIFLVFFLLLLFSVLVLEKGSYFSSPGSPQVPASASRSWDYKCEPCAGVSLCFVF